MMAEAKGAAATIVEQGRSQAEGLQDLVIVQAFRL